MSVVMLALTGCSATQAADPQGTARGQVRLAHRPAAIVIDPQGITFAPAPASATARLSAQQAWARFIRHDTAIPAGVHARLGLFTLPVGPADFPGASHLIRANGEAYTALNQLAYGYSSPSRCVTMNPLVLAPPDARCIFWDFVNASTGKQIVSTYQKIGHWHWLYNPEGL